MDSNTIKEIANQLGVNGIDEMDMPVYELFDKIADIIDQQER